MDAIVTAGGIPLPEEPLYPVTQGESKAMVDIAGKPMIQWILDALTDAKTIDNVIIVGLTEKSGLQCGKKTYYVSNQGKMVENLQAGARKVKEINPQATHAVLVSSDIPGITGEMVDWVVNTDMQTDLDVYYHLIERSVMEKRYPGCKRTWTKLKGLEVCGGDLNVGRLTMLMGEETDIWDKITDARKSPLKQAALVGFGTAVRLMTGQLTLEKAEADIMSKLNLTGRAILCPYAEVGMDVDKLFQLEIMREDLKKQTRKAARAAKGKAPKSDKPASKKTGRGVSLEQLLALDASLSKKVRVAERPGLLRSVAAFLAHSGDSWFWWAGLAILWLLGDAFWKLWGLTVLLAIIGLAVIVLAIKFSIRRRRPEGEWGAIYRSTDPHSFPSGHAARAVLIAVLAIGLGPGWLALVLAVWAPLVVLARVAMGLHYVSDVLAGSLLGALAGGMVLLIR